jgi:hypothetical protein
MKKLARLAGFTAIALIAAPLSVFAADSPPAASASTPVGLKTGQMLYDSNGHRIANVYRVTLTGNAELIIDGKLVTVLGSTISNLNGKLVTSLSKVEIGHKHSGWPVQFRSATR